MPFSIIRNDITRVHADAIVNTANPEPAIGSGTDQAIYEAAGEARLLKERAKIGNIAPGEAAVTSAFRLHARYLLHTVGPIWLDGNHGESDILASCYRKCLLLANQLGCKSIAFPLISTGNYRFPKDLALQIALNEIAAFLEDSEMLVTLVVFDPDAFRLSDSLMSGVEQYIDDHEARNQHLKEYGSSGYSRREVLYSNRMESAYEADFNISASMPSMPAAARSRDKKVGFKPTASLDDVMNHIGETFQEMLLRQIDERGMTDTEVYKRANIDRKLFSKIRCNRAYKPKKTTAIALAIALELGLDETVDLLGRAGLALSPSDRFDLIVEYCIEHEIYKIYEVNALLFHYQQPLLG